MIIAQDTKEKAGQSTDRATSAKFDKETIDLYQKGLPYLEKYKDLLKAKNADKFDIRQVAMKLQNVYYNLTLLNVDKNAEYEAIQKELESLSE